MQSELDKEVAQILDGLDPQETEELFLLLSDQPRTFREYVDACRPGYVWYKHNVILANVLQRVADGELRYVMVFMPPRHGKSEEVSRLFSGYYLERYPDRWVGLASYGATLAYKLSRSARQYFEAAGNHLEHSRAIKEWLTPHNAGLWAVGAGGAATGSGMHLGIVDDPVKDAVEAASETVQDRNNDWWDSVFTTRAEPHSAIVLIQTRWHEKDLAGYVLRQEHGEKPRYWHIVDLPAIREPEEEKPFYPDTCTIEPDWREVGEALCPERYNEETLLEIKSKDAYTFASLYQQRPRPREGGFFKKPWFKITEEIPTKGVVSRYWDRASTKDGGDFTVGVKMKRNGRRYYVLDVKRGQWAAGERDRWIKQIAKADGEDTRIGIEQDPGSAGKDAARALLRELDGYAARAYPVSGNKEVRAEPFQSACERGDVYLLKANWNDDFIDELCAFPKGLHDDQVDACSGVYKMIRKKLVVSVAPGGVKGTNQWTFDAE